MDSPSIFLRPTLLLPKPVSLFTLLHDTRIKVFFINHYFALCTTPQLITQVMEGEEDMEIDPSIAAAMGFSSFGAKPGEKRKYNSNEGYVDPAISTQNQRSAPSSSRPGRAVNLPVNPVNMSQNKKQILTTNVSAKTPAEATL